MGEVSQDVSLGAALVTFREAFNEEEMNLFNWHLANLEYANASLVSMLSLAFWDQDDPYDMGGDHCFLPGGNGKLVQALVENVPIHYGKTVEAIHYGSDGVQVAVGGGRFTRSFNKVYPRVPQRKLDAIKRLGFGLLNKVALLFPHAFWGTDLDTFGHLSDHPSRRGEFFLFYSYATVAGGPLLIALVAGEAAYRFETEDPTVSVRKVLRILRVGASGDDYDILAESVGDGRLFFAGEATNRRYPATMHGALLSGFREAANMAHYARVRALSSTVEKNPSQDAHTCASILADLFRQPDVEFGSFAVLYGRKDADSMAVLRVTFGGDRKKPDQQYSNKLLFEQLQSHFNQQQEFHIYTLLSKKQALELREVRGGDDARLNYLCEKLGVKLIGRKGLGPSADSVIASIKAARSNRSHNRKSSSSGGCSEPKDTYKHKPKHPCISLNISAWVARAKIIRNSNRFSIPSTNIGSKVSSSGNDVESRTLASSNDSISLGSDIGVRAFCSNTDLPTTTPDNGADFVGDIGCSIPQNLGHNNGLTAPFGSNMASTASCSNNNLAPPDLNVGMMLLGDSQGSNAQNFLASSLTAASSNDLERVLSITDSMSLPHMDAHMDLLGGTSGSNTQIFVSSNVSVALPCSEIGIREVSSNSSLAPSNSISHGFDSQTYGGSNSDNISCISNQENIFEDIMNDPLPHPMQTLALGNSQENCRSWNWCGHSYQLKIVVRHDIGLLVRWT
ncbi:hypothetical protein DH2020_010586 [Rehmannia glutinosa]|uniref:Amine oxidase domain-containing protein n=1 Tax=Rehmannia glutinosa TaxID=99300 RepID=A0ABR0XB17_REHGL